MSKYYWNSLLKMFKILQKIKKGKIIVILSKIIILMKQNNKKKN